MAWIIYSTLAKIVKSSRKSEQSNTNLSGILAKYTLCALAVFILAEILIKHSAMAAIGAEYHVSNLYL